jgi:hypothetical protein
MDIAASEETVSSPSTQPQKLDLETGANYLKLNLDKEDSHFFIVKPLYQSSNGYFYRVNFYKKKQSSRSVIPYEEIVNSRFYEVINSPTGMKIIDNTKLDESPQL